MKTVHFLIILTLTLFSCGKDSKQSITGRGSLEAYLNADYSTVVLVTNDNRIFDVGGYTHLNMNLRSFIFKFEGHISDDSPKPTGAIYPFLVITDVTNSAIPLQQSNEETP